jgi:hypothetical protein
MMHDSRKKLRILATSDCLHIPTMAETPRHIKILIHVFFQDNWGKWSEFLSAFDFIYTILYFRAAGVG